MKKDSSQIPKKIYSIRVAIANLQDLLEEGYTTLEEEELLEILGIKEQK